MTQIVLVIGGDGGIGSAVVDAFAARGDSVCATYYQEENPPQKKAGVDYVHCDLVNDEEVRLLVEKIIQKEGHIDAVINTATAPLSLLSFEKTRDDSFRESWETAVLGSVHLFRAILPVMKQQRSGVVVNLLSATALEGAVHMSAYASAKAGLLGLMKSVAKEMERHNVRIIGISPSFVETKLLDAFPPKLLELEREKLPEGKFFQPNDIAALVLKVIEEPNEYPTGTNIII